MRKSFYRLLICSMPLLLTACGEGWEAQRTTDVFPYGNARTAGSGVVYVRTKMMPQKELVVEPQSEAKAVPPAAEPTINADKVFNESQMKGAKPVAAAPAETSATTAPADAAVTPPAAAQEIKKESSLQGQKVDSQKHASSMSTDQKVANVAPAAGAMLAPPMTKAVEGAKAQAGEVTPPANVVTSHKMDTTRSHFSTALNTEMESASGARHPQEQEVSVSGVGSPNGALAPPPPLAAIKPTQVSAVSSSSDDMITMKKNEIVTPKKDVINPLGAEGRRTLEQIYENPF